MVWGGILENMDSYFERERMGSSHMSPGLRRYLLSYSITVYNFQNRCRQQIIDVKIERRCLEGIAPAIIFAYGA